MKLSQFRKLIREEVRKVLNEAISPDKKYYWYEVTIMGRTTSTVITGKQLLDLKKLYDADFDDYEAYMKKEIRKYFTLGNDVFDSNSYWDEVKKLLPRNKVVGGIGDSEDGFFAISPNSMEEAKKFVKQVKAEESDDD